MSGDLDGLYQDVIMDHARRKVGAGDPSGHAHERLEVNPTCGDEVTVGVTVEDGSLRLEWRGRGCAISTASASVMSELLEGRSPEEATALIVAFRDMMRSQGEGEPDETLGDAEVFHGVSRFVMRVKCAMLPWVALEGALADAGAS